MKPSAHTPRGPPTSGTMPVQLLHTLFVFSATSLMLIIAILSFLLTLFMKFIMPAPSPAAHRRRGGERHVTFLEPSIVITLPAPPRAPAHVNTPTPASTATTTATLSLTTTPHELEPPTPDVAEDPLRALSRTCGFLAANMARGLKGEELAVTPPLAGLEPYLAAVRKDLARIENEGEEDDESESESEEGDSHSDAEVKEGAVVAVAGKVQVGDRQDAGAGADAGEGPGAGKGDAAAAGAGSGVGADAPDEPGLVPDQATRATPPPLPPTQLPTQSQFPEPPAIATTTPMPPASASLTPPEPTVQNAASPDQTDTTPIPIPSTSTSTTRRPPPPPPPTTTSTIKRPPPPPPPIVTTPTPPTPTPAPNPGPRKRKDAVLRPTRPTTILGPGGLVLSATGVTGIAPGAAPANDSNPPQPQPQPQRPCDAADADELANSDDAAVRAAALFSRVADLGAGLFEGTVRERGAALWTALSRGRGAPSDVPVPQMPRTRFATGAAERG